MLVTKRDTLSVLFFFVFLLVGRFMAHGGIVMKGWEAHFSFDNFRQVIEFNNAVYAVSNGSLCSIDKESGEVSILSKITSLHDANINLIDYNAQTNTLLIVYYDGGLDVMTIDDTFYMVDIVNKQMTQSKSANDVFMYKHLAYLSMPFGIVVINLTKREVADVYYIGENSSDVNVLQTVIFHDSIYAVAENRLYNACINDNLSDFNNWKQHTFIGKDHLQNIATLRDSLYLLVDNHIYVRSVSSHWEQCEDTMSYKKLKVDLDRLFSFGMDGQLYTNVSQAPLFSLFGVEDVIASDDGYWAVCNNSVVYHYKKSGELYTSYIIDGPATNQPYRMHIANGQLYVVQGSRWAAQDFKAAYVMKYDGQHWQNIYPTQIIGKTHMPANDFMNIAVDPFDPEHFFVTSYGTGIYEFRNMSLFRHYSAHNSPLGAANSDPVNYTRTDAAFYDSDGNLWVINVGNQSLYNLHIIQPSDIASEKEQYTWFYTRFMESPSSSSYIDIGIPQEIIVDRSDSRYKWIPQARIPSGLFLFFDNGTPFNASDDYTLFRSSFVDQDNNQVNVSGVYCGVQDHDGVIWLGTNNGIITILSIEEFANSNKCEKIKIPRDDGSDLADFLLDGKQINALAVDGANRKWIGTATSGLYLMSEDGLQTIEHFTTENSPLPTDEILSIAIEPQSGRVFIGTALGILSYQSDASQGQPSLKSSNIYAYPNPVRADFEGYITIRGLMENTVVNITDSYGNLVCKTFSNGGIAVWDGRNAQGKKVPTGVYTALCNTKDGTNHGLCKILIIH